jgi:hypothetical protein
MERFSQPDARATRRELSRRTSAGLEVVLYWYDHTSSVTVSVLDERTGESFEIEVDGADALDAFHHPYAYSGGTKVPLLSDA